MTLIYHNDKKITREEARNIIAEQIDDTLIAKVILDEYTDWEDVSEDGWLLDAAHIIFTYFEFFGHIDFTLWKGEDGKYHRGRRRVYPENFGLKIEKEMNKWNMYTC